MLHSLNLFTLGTSGFFSRATRSFVGHRPKTRAAGGTLEKIKQPKSLLSRNEEVYVSKEVKVNALDSHERANHSDQK